MSMRPEQIQQAQTLLSQVDHIHQAHACVITGDLSIETLPGGSIFDLVEDDAYERIKNAIATELTTSFGNKLNELRALEVDVSEFELSQLSDYR